MGYWGKGGSYVAHNGMPKSLYNSLKKPQPYGPNWECRCGSDECWECMHLLYAAYVEAYATEAANKAGAPLCPCSPKGYTERHICSCGNWFCDHCGDHIDSSIDKSDGHVCWAGAA